MSSFVSKIVAKYGEHRFEEISRSWCLQDRWERQHRLKTVVALSVELERLCAQSRFSSAFGEMAIEAAINGNWREVEQVAGFLTFESEGPEIREKYGPLWERFRAVAAASAAAAIRRQPGTEPASN